MKPDGVIALVSTASVCEIVDEPEINELIRIYYKDVIGDY